MDKQDWNDLIFGAMVLIGIGSIIWLVVTCITTLPL